MSRSIDERVVEMRFDNKQFESNAIESIGTLGKLRDALSSATSKDFTNLEKVANSINFSGLGGAVDAVSLKFSALEIVAITALQNIVNKAVDAGIRIAKSLSVDQISAGFGEYELKMGSIQTIMASTGESLETVNGYLDELNTYADKTIYSFSDMTSNIGKFTNAGVKLEDAVKAIQGVSNVAAVSGANANEASRAMYNFAQALSAGYVKLIDWKSIENANMATVEFKEALLDTALAMGTVVKEGDKYRSTTKDLNGKTSQLFDATSMFNDSLSSQWMTTDVLVQALNNYSTDVREMSDAEREAYEEKLRTIGYTEEQIKDIEELGKKAFDSAQDVKTATQLMDTLKESVGSGWAQTFELIVGDFEEAKQLWTVVNNEIGTILQNQSDSRNELLKGWKELGGRSSLLNGIGNTWNAFLDIVVSIKEAFLEIFPPATAQDLFNITKGFENLTKKFQLSDDQLEKLNTAFRGVFSVIDVVAKAIKGFFNLLLPGVSSVSTLGNSVLDLAAWIGELLISFDEWVSSSETIKTIYEVLSGSVKTLSDWISIGIASIRDFVSEISKSEIVQDIISGIKSAFEKLGDIFTTFKIKFSPFKTVFDLFSSIVETVGPIAITIFNGIGQALGSLADGFKKVMGSGESGDLLDLLDVGLFAYVIKAIDTLVEKIDGLKKGLPGGIIEKLMGNVDKLFGGLTDTLSNLQNVLKGEVIMKIAEAIAVLAGSMLILSLIDASRLADSLTVMSTMLLEVFGLMDALSRLTGPTNPISAISSYFTSMAQSKTLESVAKSVLILSAALYLIAQIDKDKLFGAFAVISGLIIEMGVLVRALSDPAIGKMKTGVAPLLGVATAILILASAAKKLAELSWEQVAKGLFAVGGLMTELGLFMAAANKFGKFSFSSGVGILLLAAAIKVLEGPIMDFSKMSLTELAKGIGALAVALTAIVLALNLMPDKGAVGSAAAILILAAAIKVLEGPITDFSKMSLVEIAKGLGVLLGALLAIALAFNLMPDKGSFGGAVSILIAAAAVRVLEDALVTFSNFSVGQIAAGLITLAGSLIILAAGAYAMDGAIGGAAAMLVMAAALRILAPVIQAFGDMSVEQIAKSLITLAGTFIIMGVAGTALSGLVPVLLALSGAMALFGVGMLAFGAGLTMIAASATAAVTAIIAVLKILIVGILDVIASTATKLGEAVLAVIFAICDVIGEAVPKIAETVFAVIDSVINTLADHAPEIVSGLIRFIVGVIDSLTEHIPELIQSVINFVSTFFGAIVDVLNDLDTEAMEKFLTGFGLVSGIMVVLAGLSTIAAAAMAGVIEMGIVIGELGVLLAAIGALKQIPGLHWLIDEGGEMLESIGTAIGKFIGGFVGGALEGMTAGLPQIGTNLSDFMSNISGFIEGASKIDPALMQGVEALAGVILTLTKADILEGLTSWFTGGTSLADFGQQLEDFAPHIANYANIVAGIDPTVVQASANAALALAEMAEKLPPQDGLMQKISGQTTLSDFGEELEDFAPHISKYATAVAGVTPEAVEASASAATILADMADKLPNNGGLSGLIFGENNLSEFGEELEKFGPSMAAYAASVAGIDSEAVTASAAAAESLAALARGLPNEGGAVSLFAGDNTLSNFGDDLADFGEDLTEYYNSISGIDTNKMAAIVTSIQGLITLFMSIGTVTTEPMLNFVKGLGEVGNLGIENFVEAFSEGQSKAREAVNSFLDAIQNAFTNAANIILEAGSQVSEKIIEGIISKLPDFSKAGDDSANEYVNGIALNEHDFNDAGSNAAQGFIDGINLKLPDVSIAGTALGKAALDAAKAILQEKSPSKAFHQIGDYGGIGFAKGLLENTQQAYNAGRDLGGSSLDGVANAISAMSDYINNNMDPNPTITPILDLSEVQASSSQLASILNGSIGTTRINAAGIGIPSSYNRFNQYGYGLGIQNGANPQNSTTEINNTFYVQSHDPQGVADETSRIIQRQVVRRDAANGRTGL